VVVHHHRDAQFFGVHRAFLPLGDAAFQGPNPSQSAAARVKEKKLCLNFFEIAIRGTLGQGPVKVLP
jgi:hypothetical protein